MKVYLNWRNKYPIPIEDQMHLAVIKELVASEEALIDENTNMMLVPGHYLDDILSIHKTVADMKKRQIDRNWLLFAQASGAIMGSLMLGALIVGFVVSLTH